MATKVQVLNNNDVRQLIQQNGGTADGLDLSGRKFDSDALFDLDLSGSNLQGADLRNLELEETNLSHAKLRGAKFYNNTLVRDVITGIKLDGADFGDYKAGEELDNQLYEAEAVYRGLKQLHSQFGMHDTAGHFYFREMEIKRKLAWQRGSFGYAAWLWSLKLLCGYGERWWQVIAWALGIVFGFGVVYWRSGLVEHGDFLSSLYFSAVSFTAVGYGGWLKTVESWAQTFGVIESYLGVFLNALFLVTFVRKMSR